MLSSLKGEIMKRTLECILSFALVFLFGFTSCEPQLQELLPAERDTPTIEVTSLGDPFENGKLQNPNWKWQNEPPVWDIGETRDNHLFMDTEPNRNLWVTDATHLLYQEIETDVFDVETKFMVRWDTSSGVTGLVVKSPADDNWVTLKFWARDASARGFIQFDSKANQSRRDGFTGGAWQSPVTGELDLFFRLAKDGDTYTSWYKTEANTDWIQVGVTEFKLTPPLWLGIYAGVAAGRGSLQTEFEYFRDNIN